MRRQRDRPVCPWPFLVRPELEALEPRALLTTFTMTSPTVGGPLPEGVSPVGGIVFDLIGANGRRVVSQVRASDLFVGVFSRGEPAEYRGNPGTIGERSGFSPRVLDALGGGLAELSVRLTVDDGDSGPGDFDREDNTLLINGIAIGRFDAVPTVETDPSGLAIRSENPDGGFRDNLLDTGFFHLTDPETLQLVFESLQANGSAAFQLLDEDPFDNFFDFTVGLDAALIDVELPPEPRNEPPQIVSISVPEPLSEGQTALVVVLATDPDPGDELTYTFSRDGPANALLEPSDTPGRARLTALDDGPIRILVRVEDALGAFDESAQTVEVRNLPPRLQQASIPGWVELGTSVLLVSSFVDPGALDPLAVRIDWGNGSISRFDLPPGSTMLEADFSYSRIGSYVITLAVSDNLGESAVVALPIVVEAPERPRLPAFRLPIGTAAEPPSGNQALALALLPADPGGPDRVPIAPAPADPFGASPIAPAAVAAPIAILVGQDSTDAGRSPVPPSPGDTASPVSPAEDASPIPSPTPPTENPSSEVASAASGSEGAEQGAEVVLASAGSPGSQESPDADPDAPPATISAGPALAVASSGESASPASAGSGNADPGPGPDPGSKAMRATALIIAVLTVRRGGARIRSSLGSSSRRPLLR